jgi:hypothetical protein
MATRQILPQPANLLTPLPDVDCEVALNDRYTFHLSAPQAGTRKWSILNAKKVPIVLGSFRRGGTYADLGADMENRFSHPDVQMNSVKLAVCNSALSYIRGECTTVPT